MEMTKEEQVLITQFERAMGVVGAKWKPAILYCLVFGGRLRFSELRKLIPDVTQKMLTQRLRELERDGLVQRTLYPTVPLRVEYELTELGQSAHPVLRDFCHWAEAHFDEIDRANADYDRTPS